MNSIKEKCMWRKMITGSCSVGKIKIRFMAEYYSINFKIMKVIIINDSKKTVFSSLGSEYDDYILSIKQFPLSPLSFNTKCKERRSIKSMI